ncbi:MAG: methyltransferase domain-containing protein [Flavobacteriaceae bacterium]|nr:methyltransferase domain-containing protein [Flavobacteriaceae bacterium]
MNNPLYVDSYKVFCRYVTKRNATIFDIACGPGNISKYLLNKRPDYQIFGIDIAPNMIKLAEKNNPTAEFQVMDCRDIHQINKKFDAAICGFGLPYISKEEAIDLIANVSKLVSENGYLYLSTMEDDHKKSGFTKSSSSEDMAYIYYHLSDYLEKALYDNHFSVVEVFRRKYPKYNTPTSNDLFIIAKKV